MSIFTKVQQKKINSNVFDLSYDRKFSTVFGQLTPIHVMECLPGDNISIQTSQLLRMAPMVAPVMHQASVYTHYFFVPNRLLWDNWEKFITGGEDGLADPPAPFIYMPQVTAGSIYDYMGLPINSTLDDTTKINPFALAAYNFIFNEFYRDQNLQDPLDYKLIDGSNFGSIDFALQFRAWQHDYFTSALPWTQKGPEATIPLGTEAPIVYQQTGLFDTDIKDENGNLIAGHTAREIGTTNPYGKPFFYDDETDTFNIDNSKLLKTDLSDASASSINDLRRAFKLQEWLEKNARAGSRYIEALKAHFGVSAQDSRLQRPEFLGGSSAPITISEVLQTSDAAAGETPQGNMAGHGISAGGGNSINYNVKEHGYIIGIQSVLPKSAYQQGIDKHFQKFDRFDYAFPVFGNLGEQPIRKSELFYENGNQSANESTFGYTPRYAEYKFMNSSVHGQFKTTLDFWHMGRIFDTAPSLNEEFIKMKPAEVARIFAVTDSETLYCHCYHRIKARRKLPYFGTPTL